MVQCFVGDHNTFRRNVARWDSTAPNEPDEPNATFSNYNCSSNLWENNVSLDYGVPETPMMHGGDFYSPNNLAVYPTGNIENVWVGNIAVNHAVQTDNRRAFQADVSGGNMPLPGNVMRDFYVRGNGVGFVIKSNYEFTIERCTMVDVSAGAGTWGSGGGATPIDCGEPAEVEHRYINGELTMEPLWPFPHEALIKEDLCAPGERQSEYCLYDGDLHDYLMGL